MNCSLFNHHLDDYVDNDLDAVMRQRMADHVRTCHSCQYRLETARSLLHTLKTLPAPAPDNEFFDAALAKAARLSSHRRWPVAIGGSMAAGLGMIMVVSLWLTAPPIADTQRQQSDTAVVQIALNERREVKLVFNADTELKNARLTLHLPANVRLEGYPGRQLSWVTHLQPGRNMLVLPVSASRFGHGKLTATIEHRNAMKTFSVDLDVPDQHQSLTNELRVLLS